MDALLIVLFAWVYKNEIDNWVSNAIAEGIRRSNTSNKE